MCVVDFVCLFDDCPIEKALLQLCLNSIRVKGLQNLVSQFRFYFNVGRITAEIVPFARIIFQVE